MAFNYGKRTLDIKNPFKVEGRLDLIFGIITLIIGILQAFQIRNSIDTGFRKLAWLELILAIVFISIGVRAIIIGSMRLFKFLVGREIPSNISPNPYEKKVIEKILMNRSNPTFIEKDDFISRLLISIYDKFLFLPIGFRNLLESVSSLFLSFIIFLITYLLTIFSTSIGLISFTDKNAIITLFAIAFLVKQLIEWVYYKPSKKRISALNSSSYGYKNIVINILMAIFIPLAVEFYIRKGGVVTNLEMNTFLPISLLFILSAGLVFVTFFLSKKRLEVLNPETSVSEYKDHIQVSVHPKDLFRCFEIEMANKRYQEIPNRVYKEIKPILELEGSSDKGSFSGGTIQETQPIYEPEDLPKTAKTLRFYLAFVGRLLLIFSFIYLFFSVKTLNAEINLRLIFNVFYYPLLISFFAYYLIRIAHIFYSEILFSSYLVHFFSEGTYTESKVSSGMAVYDSNRSENTIVNTSATPWILVSKIITSTLADSSTKNLEGSRYILEMYKGDDFLNDLVLGFTNYLKDRKLIVGFDTKADIENSLGFHKLNEMTRANNDGTSNEKIEELKRDKLDE